ncbi:MAG: DnaD domain protein [Lachnospiraceae bacterium]|nr:DnaD domain protein [Lachnospiraceae bacterium]
MPRLTIYKDTYANTTVIANRFIDEYMTDANDAQLKVYLYLLRMFAAGQATSVSDMADRFNHTEKDILRALKYWEKHHLLDLDYDMNRNLVGIRLRDLNQPNGNIRVEGFHTSADALSMSTSRMPAPVDNADLTGISHSQNTFQPEENPYAKPVYNAEQLREFKNRENTAQLLFIAEQYIGRPLTPSEMKSILFFKDVLLFSDDLIDYLIQYCVDRGKKDFKYIEKVAISWAEENITTPKQAQKYSTKYDKNVYAIMNELGKNGSPTNKEMEFITRWTKEYGFSMDVIFEACERTVLATDKHRFEYAEGILSSWKRANVHHKSDIRKIDDLYQQKKKSSSAKTVSTNRFNQFTQNNYDFAALEQELLSN